MFLFLLSLSFLLNIFAFGHPFEVKIEEILNSGEMIRCSDGTIWKVRSGYETIQEWFVGDKILLDKSRIFDNLYILKNCTYKIINNIEVGVSPVREPVEPFFIEGLNSEGSIIKLNNGSLFNVSWWQSWNSCEWSQKDRISVYPGLGEYEYWLINFDHPYPQQIVKATLIRESLDSSPYRHFITQVTKDVIELDNGFIWYVWQDEDISGWKPGDEVFGEYRVHRSRESESWVYYSLLNLRNFEDIGVSFGQQNDLKSLVVDHYDNEANILFLNDGSKWRDRWLSTKFHRWKQGQKVVVYKNMGNPETYVLINVTLSNKDYWLYHEYGYGKPVLLRSVPK